MDLICHHKNPYSYLYLSNLETDSPNLPSGVLQRYIINLNSKNCTHTTLSTDAQEFPRINYRNVNGKKHTFVYTNLITNPGEKFFNSIQKLNVETGKTLNWERENCYPGEAVFVPRNDNLSECNGVLLSIVYHAQGQHSSLIMLDANNMQLLAEVFLPIHLPFGLHGNFYNH
jgi:carotenoid cleavage dioxygenase-like enzyme